MDTRQTGRCEALVPRMLRGGPSLCFLSWCCEAAGSEPVDGQNTSAERTCHYRAGLLHTINMELREEDMCMDTLTRLFSTCICLHSQTSLLSSFVLHFNSVAVFISRFKLERSRLKSFLSHTLTLEMLLVTCKADFSEGFCPFNPHLTEPVSPGELGKHFQPRGHVKTLQQHSEHNI